MPTACNCILFTRIFDWSGLLFRTCLWHLPFEFEHNFLFLLWLDLFLLLYLLVVGILLNLLLSKLCLLRLSQVLFEILLLNFEFSVRFTPLVILFIVKLQFDIDQRLDPLNLL